MSTCVCSATAARRHHRAGASLLVALLLVPKSMPRLKRELMPVPCLQVREKRTQWERVATAVADRALAAEAAAGSAAT